MKPFSRLIALAKKHHAEDRALDVYPWPLPLRMAGYISIFVCNDGLYPIIGWNHPWELALVTALCGLVVYGFHVLSLPQCVVEPYKRFGIFVIQCGICYYLLFHYFSYGSEILLLVLAVEAQFLVRFEAALVISGLLWIAEVMVAVFHTPLFLRGYMAEYILSSPAGYAFVSVFTRTAVTEMVQRYRLTALLDELNEAHSQLQAHACQVEELAVARERNRMAREIHDTIGHYLTVVNVQIETAQKLRLRDPDRAESALDAAKKLATECLGEVRRSVAALRPQALEGSDLLQALGRLISELRRATRATIHVESQGEGTLPAAAEVVAYRSVQEALTNIRKHAHAKNVWVQMVWDPGWFTITIRDDGVGVDSDRLDEGYGLRGMRERLASVGGQLEIAAAGGRGMRLAISIPSAEEPAIEREQGGVAVAGG